MKTLERHIRESSLATLAGLLAHYALARLIGQGVLTEHIAEWIMAHTPNAWSVAILQSLGAWAKPAAVTGGLAALGFVLFLVDAVESHWLSGRWRKLPSLVILTAAGAARIAGRESGLEFWVVGLLMLAWLQRRRLRQTVTPANRRQFLQHAPLILVAGTAGVAVESWLRERWRAQRAVRPVQLWNFRYPIERESFAPGLVRKAITPVEAFYAMSKNTVDPVVDPMNWSLEITAEGQLLRRWSYQELLTLPRIQRITTMRCISNTLKSDLMGTAEWSGILLRQLVDPARLLGRFVEVAFIGADGHDESLPAAYAFGDEVMLALGMNGWTLNRIHGFPLRVVAPRYYGFKSVKWLKEIRFVSQPYLGTWPRMGYAKLPEIHTMSFIDRARPTGSRLQVGGVAFAGLRGIRRVEVRPGGGRWTVATLEPPLSPYSWVRWRAEVDASGASWLEARAQDGLGQWQATDETPLFPSGVAGPTIKKL
jgi:DMSO/TMAO reductase YedYZ molybdopterin-dependent catalytic subunit